MKLSSCSSPCPILWSQVLSREWRCSNYIWVINNFIVTGLYLSRLGICLTWSPCGQGSKQWDTCHHLVTMATGERGASKSVTAWCHTMRNFITSRKCKTLKMSLWQYDITRPQWVNKCTDLAWSKDYALNEQDDFNQHRPHAIPS